VNLAAWLWRAGRAHPEAPAVGVGATDVLSYGELASRAASIATTLGSRHALAPGDRVAIVAKNHPGYVEALFGAWWGGFVAVPVNPKLHPSEVGWIVEHCQARAVFVSPDLAPMAGRLDQGSLPVFEFGSPAWSQLTSTPAWAEPYPSASDDLAWLFYTSGTTGRPKGAMLSHGNLAAMTLGYLVDVDPTMPGDSLLHAAPMSHGSGLYLIAQVCRRGVNVIPESGGFDAAEALAVAGARPGVSMFAAPTMVRRIARVAPESADPAFRTLIWGGAPMYAGDVREALTRLGPCLAQIYGQGESPMTITVLGAADVADQGHPRWLHRLSSAGVANSAVDVRVATSEGRAAEIDELGEIQVRGATVMSGYWNDAPATRAALVDGWLLTGDIGSMDGEGYVTLRDRSKDVIISGGSNVYPREVEEVLLSHPRVVETSVIGRPDPEWGEVVVAYVVGDADGDELDRICLDNIARFKRPKEYVRVRELPKNSTGKTLKNVLRERDEARRRDATPGAPVVLDPSSDDR
jgi:acyl-CoA synthetase (AMP-forming)/AMP-acid ligase II